MSPKNQQKPMQYIGFWHLRRSNWCIYMQGQLVCTKSSREGKYFMCVQHVGFMHLPGHMAENCNAICANWKKKKMKNLKGQIDLSYQRHLIDFGVILMFNHPIDSSFNTGIAWGETKVIIPHSNSHTTPCIECRHALHKTTRLDMIALIKWLDPLAV